MSAYLVASLIEDLAKFDELIVCIGSAIFTVALGIEVLKFDIRAWLQLTNVQCQTGNSSSIAKKALVNVYLLVCLTEELRPVLDGTQQISKVDIVKWRSRRPRAFNIVYLECNIGRNPCN
jgi:hypothetical protein